MIAFNVNDDQREKINRALPYDRKAWGGFQHLLYRLQTGLKLRGSNWSLEMSEGDARKIVEYASETHGPGGYQERIRPLVADVERELAKLPPPLKQGSLFDDEEPAPADARGELLNAIRGQLQ